MGDGLLETRDTDLAVEMHNTFLSHFLQFSGYEFGPNHEEPRIVIYLRPSMQELRIDGPREGQEWWTTWTPERDEALTFAADAGVAAAFTGPVTE
jgi:hypothetical protein